MNPRRHSREKAQRKLNRQHGGERYTILLYTTRAEKSLLLCNTCKGVFLKTVKAVEYPDAEHCVDCTMFHWIRTNDPANDPNYLYNQLERVKEKG